MDQNPEPLPQPSSAPDRRWWPSWRGRTWLLAGVVAVVVWGTSDDWLPADGRAVDLGRQAGAQHGKLQRVLMQKPMSAADGERLKTHCAVFFSESAEERHPGLDRADYCNAFVPAALAASSQEPDPVPVQAGSPAPGPTVASAPATSSPAGTPPETAAASPATPRSTGEACVEACQWDVEAVVADLSGIVCESRELAPTLSDDVTARFAHLNADKVLVCTTGGSMDLTHLGIAYLWEDSSQLTDTVLDPFKACVSPGATVMARPPGNPGYVVAGIRSPQPVVDELVAGGAELLCPTPG